MSDMTKAELEAELRQARDKICYCECKNKELQERLSAIVAPVQSTPTPRLSGPTASNRSL